MDRQDVELLKGVSRSFYVSLKCLPEAMRQAASVAYLLARLSDTIADGHGASWARKLALLNLIETSLLTEKCRDDDAFAGLCGITQLPAEQFLLARAMHCFALFHRLPPPEQGMVREVLQIIISGQLLDLQRFESVRSSAPVALVDAAALDDYCWRVAGCVGEFWTRLGFHCFGEKFSCEKIDRLTSLGRNYGSGLQLVNILRDLPRDLAVGRCYLPVANPADASAMMMAHREWTQLAKQRVQDGIDYASTLSSRRLRVASGLPAAIAMKTLELLEKADWDDLVAGVKVPRSFVYRSVARGFLLGSHLG